MSSILKALKRIEKEAPPPDESHSWPRAIDTKKAVNSRVKKTWLYNKLLKTLVIAIIIAAVGWLVFSQRQWIVAKFMPEKSPAHTRQHSVSSKEKDSVYHAKIKTQSNRLKKTPQNSPPPPNKQRSKPIFQKKSKSAGATEPLSAVSAQNQQKQSQLPPVPPLPANTKKPLKKKTQRVQLNQQSGSTVSPNPKPTALNAKRNPAQKRKKAGEKNNFDSLSTLDDSQLKLQAIAWSEDVSRRMVVINNRIIREGETVDGFFITQIRQEDVIVSDGTNSWRLQFSLKQ